MSPASSRNVGKWWVCGLLLAALLLNYMDRQTLSLLIVPISKELGLSNAQYGQLEKGFGYAFALGGLLFGWLADKFSVRGMFPLVLSGWSAAGLASGYADRLGQALAPLAASWRPDLADPAKPGDCAFLGFLVLRTALGFFESGVWPCALITTQRLLEPADRPLGNGVLTGGASLGAILTPLVVQSLVTRQPGTWRWPFVLIGALGLVWVLPWSRLTAGVPLDPLPRPVPATEERPSVPVPRGLIARRFLALAVVVVAINLTWHFFRVWLPKMLEEYHGYSAPAVHYFTAAYYLATALGAIAAGYAVKLLSARRMTVHAARLLGFLACALLAALSTAAAALDRGPLLLALLLLVGFGSLGLFPTYYALTQDLSRRHQGKVTGALGFLTWVATAEMQQLVGQHVDRTHSYAAEMRWAGLAPAVAWLALCLLWGRGEPQPPAARPADK
jgi:ACS family hexuronate transporter-like MFS transporter